MNIKQKITTGIATGAIMLGTLSPAAFAVTDVQISGNGSDSNNAVSVRSDHRMDKTQRNDSNVNNSVNTRSNTGDNSVRGNTEGNVSANTGDVDSSARVSNMGNMNRVTNNGSGMGDAMRDNFMSKKLRAFMTGEQEVPGPGDPDGFGTAKVKVHPERGELCVSMRVGNIEPATAAHIHEAPVGVAGPVVVTLPTPNANGFASGCVAVDSNELEEIKDNPSNYYVNVHNATYPAGAVRGQLSR